MNLWWWIEHNAVHNSVTCKSDQFFHFAVVSMLVHVHEHIMARVVCVLKCMICFGTGFFSGCWSMMSFPQHNCFSRILPTAPTTFKVTFSTQWNFFCITQTFIRNKIRLLTTSSRLTTIEKLIFFIVTININIAYRYGFQTLITFIFLAFH